MANQPISVVCRPGDDGWQCQVTVGDDARATQHEVTVDQRLLGRLRPGAADPVGLVSDSFEFLLAREPRESILRSFDLPLIGRYFPDWESEIRQRRGPT